jgi:hypothetical protein
VTGTYDTHVRKKKCAQNPKESISYLFKIRGDGVCVITGTIGYFGHF